MGKALIFTLGGKCRPSTSTAADAEDYLPDSEDLILQPQSRSKRGRKKPVIKKSQEETSQQVQLHYKIEFIITIFIFIGVSCYYFILQRVISGGTVASWLVRLTLDQVVRDQVPTKDIVLCSCVRHFYYSCDASLNSCQVS